MGEIHLDPKTVESHQTKRACRWSAALSQLCTARDAGTIAPRARVPRIGLQRRESLIALASVLPAFVLVGVVIWYPISRTIYYSFTNWNGAAATWIGFANYSHIVSNGELWLLFRNNLIFVASVPGILIISLVVAVLLFEEIPGWQLFRSVYYLPTILSTAVVGTLMRVMFSSHGAVNDILDALGLASLTHDWLGSVPTAFMVLIFVFYWQTLGQGVLIFLAGLAAIPGDLLDAARLDGAGWWNRLTRIIVPLLMPTIAYFVVINLIWVFVGLFALVFTVTGGGPGYATTPFDLMIYRKAFQIGDLGYASALAVVLFAIVLVIAAAQLRLFERITTD